MTERKPRRRWLWIPGVLLAVALLAGAAELALRLIIPGVIANAVRDGFGLSAEHPVEVALDGLALRHAIAGRVGDVQVTVPDAELVEGLRGTVQMHADSMPVDPSRGEIEGGSAALVLDRDQLPAAISLLTSGAADGGEVSDGELVVSRTAQIFGMDVTLSVDLALSVEDGDVSIEPTAIGAAGFDLSSEQIRSMVGGSFDGVLTAHTVCVRDRLPAGITLTGIELSSTGAVRLDAGLAPDILSDPASLEPGSC